jgi:hypothetical protein
MATLIVSVPQTCRLADRAAKQENRKIPLVHSRAEKCRQKISSPIQPVENAQLAMAAV